MIIGVLLALSLFILLVLIILDMLAIFNVLELKRYQYGIKTAKIIAEIVVAALAFVIGNYFSSLFWIVMSLIDIKIRNNIKGDDKND